MKRVYRLNLFRNTKGQWQYRLVSPSGVKMHVAESYASKSNAKRAVARFAKLLAVGVVIEEVAS